MEEDPEEIEYQRRRREKLAERHREEEEYANTQTSVMFDENGQLIGMGAPPAAPAPGSRGNMS